MTDKDKREAKGLVPKVELLKRLRVEYNVLETYIQAGCVPAPSRRFNNSRRLYYHISEVDRVAAEWDEIVRRHRAKDNNAERLAMKLWTQRELGEVTGLAHTSIQWAIHMGRLTRPSTVVGGRVYYTNDEAQAFIKLMKGHKKGRRFADEAKRKAPKV